MRLRYWLPFLVAAAAAQQPAPTPYVLHVYANLVQVPTLALTTDYTPLPPLARQQFNIRLDAGPAFHPTQMRMEGDDPITLAVLLDASGPQQRLLNAFAPAFANLAHTSLHPQDTVSLFAVDCTLIRSANAQPANSSALAGAVTQALTAPGLHHNAPHPSCERSLHLWDALATIVNQMARTPGRKVILIVSSGIDHHSATTFASLRELAESQGITLFGVRDLVRFVGDYGAHNLGPSPSGVYLAPGHTDEDIFIDLCEGTGGLILTTNQQDLAPTLQRIVTMLRGRYILEFPRPEHSTAGRHSIDVTVPSRRAYIATAGVTVALPDPALAADPSTVPSTTHSPAVLGTRRPLDPPH
jgi:VWFA-related protein